MKLLADSVELALPADFQFEIIENNPFFSEEGSQSIPTTLPATAVTISKLNIGRAGMKNRFMRKFPAKLMAGSVHKDGQLVISSKSDKSIIGSIMLNESDLYTKMKEQKLPDIFSKISKVFTTPEAAYNYLYSVYKCEVVSDFAVFPVAVNLKDTGEFTLLNEPDNSGEVSEILQLKWKARTIMYNGESASVPDGFGITPFIFLHRLIDMTFLELGYTVDKNPFRTESPLSKIVLTNTVSDTICKSRINYSQVVPSCTVSDFLEFLMNRFHATAFVDAESLKIDIVLFEDTLTAVYDDDLSAKCVKSYTINYLDRKALNLVENTDIDEAKPAFETREKMFEKYQVQGSDFKVDDATGTCFEISNGPSGLLYKFLGTMCMNFLADSTLEKETFQAKDLAIRMLIAKCDHNVPNRIFKIPVPYLGPATYCNTKYNNEKLEDRDQKIMLCYTAGRALPVNEYYTGFFYGTTQKYRNDSAKWCDISLDYPGLFHRFWKNYCTLLLNQSLEFSAEIRYSSAQIATFTIGRQKLFNGVPVLIKSRKLNIGNITTYGNTEMLSTRLYEPVQNYSFPEIGKHEYYWVIFDDVNSYIPDEREFEVIVEYEDSIPNFKDIPVPTPEQIETGGAFYKTGVSIIVKYKRPAEIEWQYNYHVAYYWVEPRKA